MIAGAFVFWLVGRWLIAFATRTRGPALLKQQLDVTLTKYLQTGLSVVLNAALLVAILGFFGVETTTFAALIAAGGVAIGVAWGGLLANFAGSFLVFLRPFKVGDFITIQNFSANPYRRVDMTATINNSVDHHQAIRLLKDRLARIPNVLSSPAPDGDVLQFTPAGPQLCVRPYCANQHYWQVYFDTNRLIRESFGEAGFPAPLPAYSVSGVMPVPLQH